MPTDSILIRARKNRTADFTLSLFESDGTTAVNLAADDNCRVKIGRGESTPDIEADKDGVPYAGGSRTGAKTSWTAGNNDVTLHLEREDTANLEAGAYDLEVIVVDAADSVKHVQAGVFSLAPSLGGETDIEESSGGSSGSSASSSSSS
jgi:hypothetical protein